MNQSTYAKGLEGVVAAESEICQIDGENGRLYYRGFSIDDLAVYALLGISKELFTPVFAVARTAGWLAQILEQRKDNRLYRPKCLYTGPEPVEYVPIDDR